jgi:hypothetical protein
VCIRKGSLDNDYLDNFNNEFLNKYEKNVMNMFFLMILDEVSKDNETT